MQTALSRITPLYPQYVTYFAECLARRYQVAFLKSLVWHDLGLNPGLRLIIYHILLVEEEVGKYIQERVQIFIFQKTKFSLVSKFDK